MCPPNDQCHSSSNAREEEFLDLVIASERVSGWLEAIKKSMNQGKQKRASTYVPIQGCLLLDFPRKWDFARRPSYTPFCLWRSDLGKTIYARMWVSQAIYTTYNQDVCHLIHFLIINLELCELCKLLRQGWTCDRCRRSLCELLQAVTSKEAYAEEVSNLS